MAEKTEKELLEYIKFKNKLDSLNQAPGFEKTTKNPFDTLTFDNIKTDKKKKNQVSYKFWLSVIVVFFLATSVLFNGVISSKLDPVLYELINNLSVLANKPYVVTIGNFKTFEAAKSKAIDLLPKLKQINIKQLPTGNYTFEIEKCGSKEKAYSIANEFTQNGFESVNVRYLPGQ